MSSEELTFATQEKLQCEPKKDASNVIKLQSPPLAQKYGNALIEIQNEQKQQLTPLEPSSMFVEDGQ